MRQELLQPVELGKLSAKWGILRLPINLQWNAEPVWRWLNNHLTDPPKIKPWVLDLGQLDSSHDPMIQWHPNFLNLLGSKNWIGSTKLLFVSTRPPTKLTRQKSQSYGGLANLLSFRKGWCSGFMTCWFSRVELVMFGQLVNNSATFILAGQCKCPFDGLYSSEPAIHVHHINSID